MRKKPPFKRKFANSNGNFRSDEDLLSDLPLPTDVQIPDVQMYRIAVISRRHVLKFAQLPSHLSCKIDMAVGYEASCFLDIFHYYHLQKHLRDHVH